MDITSGIANINQIPSRSHSSLQNLNNNDHPFYSAEANRIALASFTQGLDAAKSGTPSAGAVYFATDTLKLYECFVSNTWVQVSDPTLPVGYAQGAVIYYDGVKWNTLAAGASGTVLTSNGAGSNPTWVAGASLLSAFGSKSSTPYSMQNASATDVDSTNLSITLSGWTVGQPFWYYAGCQTNYTNTINASYFVGLSDITNSVSMFSQWGSGGANRTNYQNSAGGIYIPASFPCTIRMQSYEQQTGNAASIVNNTGGTTSGLLNYGSWVAGNTAANQTLTAPNYPFIYIKPL